MHLISDFFAAVAVVVEKLLSLQSNVYITSNVKWNATDGLNKIFNSLKRYFLTFIYVSETLQRVIKNKDNSLKDIINVDAQYTVTPNTVNWR